MPRQGEGTYIAQLICGNTPEVARVFSTRPFTMPPIKESESISLKFCMEEAWGSAIYGFAHVSFAPRRKNRSRGQSLAHTVLARLRGPIRLLVTCRDRLLREVHEEEEDVGEQRVIGQKIECVQKSWSRRRDGGRRAI